MDSDNLRRGIIPGVIAGYVMLAYMGAGVSGVVTGEDGMSSAVMGTGMVDAIAGMIGGAAFIGFILHVIISAVIGALYTGLFMQYAKSDNPLVNIVAGGLAYGVIWWIIGPNIIMPVIAGGDLFTLDINGASFFGHIIFGHVLAFLVVLRDMAMGAASNN